MEVDTELRNPLRNQLVDEVELETLAAATDLGKRRPGLRRRNRGRAHLDVQFEVVGLDVVIDTAV